MLMQLAGIHDMIRQQLKRQDFLKYLKEHGANIHANDDVALYYSTKRECYDVVEYLIENGANLEAVNPYGYEQYLLEYKGNL